MKELLKMEIYYIELFHIISLCISILFFKIMHIKAKKGPLLYTFSYVNSLMVLWMIAKVLKTVSPNVDIRWFFIVFQYFAISMLEAAFLEFAYCYAMERTFSFKQRVYVYILPITQFVVVLTNPYHHLFYSYYDFWKDSFGPIFYLYMLIEYMYIFIGIVLCAIKLGKLSKEKKQIHIVLIGIAIMIPFIFNILFVTLTIDRFLISLGIYFVFDITPIAFTFSLIIFIFITFQYSFIDVEPIMKHEMIQKLNMPILITNPIFTNIEGNFLADKNIIPYLDESLVQKIKNANAAYNEITIGKGIYFVSLKEIHIKMHYRKIYKYIYIQIVDKVKNY